MNDSFRANIFVQFPPETIACACIYIAARKLQVPLPSKPSWFALFRVSESDIKFICTSILSLYTREKPNVEKLEDEVARLKKLQLEAKAKSKGAAAIKALEESNTPNSNNGVSPKEFSSPFKNEKTVVEMGLKEHIINNQLKAAALAAKDTNGNGHRDNSIKKRSRKHRSRSREPSYDSRSNHSSSSSSSPSHRTYHRRHRHNSDNEENRSRDKHRTRRRSRSPYRKTSHRHENRDRKSNKDKSSRYRRK